MERNATTAAGGTSSIFIRLHQVLQNLEMRCLETIKKDTIDSLESAADQYARLQSALDKFKVNKIQKYKLIKLIWNLCGNL